MSVNWTVDGRPVVAVFIAEPGRGRWLAQVQVQGVAELASACVLRCENGPHEWHGSIAKQSNYQGFTEATILGCPSLESTVPAAGYKNTTSKIVAREAVEAAGGTLDPSSNAWASLPFWARKAATLADSLNALCVTTGETWRVMRDGRVFVGTPAYAESKTEGVETDRDMQLGCIHYVSDTPDLAPWLTVDGNKLHSVEHTISDSVHLARAFLAQ